jgi:hypothetical protein
MKSYILTVAYHEPQQYTDQLSSAFSNWFHVWPIGFWSISFVQQWLRIHIAQKCGRNDALTKELHSALSVSRKAAFEFTTRITTELGAT